MLENIALIASVISAITAVTTSIRALGKAHENVRSNIKSGIATGCRLSNSETSKSFGSSSNLLTYVISTFIWLVLSIVFALPKFNPVWTNGFDTGLVFFLFPFVVLIILILFIWRKILYLK